MNSAVRGAVAPTVPAMIETSDPVANARPPRQQILQRWYGLLFLQLMIAIMIAATIGGAGIIWAGSTTALFARIQGRSFAVTLSSNHVQTAKERPGHVSLLVSNLSDKSLRITEAATSCSCASLDVQPPVAVPPHGFRSVDVELSGERDKARSSVRLAIDDGDKTVIFETTVSGSY